MAHRKKKKTNRSTAEELMRMYDRWTPGVGRQSLMQSDPTWSAATAINTPFKRSIMTSSPWDMIRKELIDRGSQRVADSVGPWLGQGTTPMRNPVSTVTTKRQAGPPRHQLTAALQRRDPREQVRQDLTRDKVGDRVIPLHDRRIPFIASETPARTFDIPVDHGQGDFPGRMADMESRGMRDWYQQNARERMRMADGTAAPSLEEVQASLARGAERQRRKLVTPTQHELNIKKLAEQAPDVSKLEPEVTSVEDKKDIPMGILEAKDYETIDFVPPKQREELVEAKDNSEEAVKRAVEDTSGNTIGGVDRSREMERIWGKFAYDPAARKKVFLNQLNDIFMKGMLLDMVATMTGNRSQSAAYTKFALGKLEAVQKFDEEERLYNIYRGVYYLEDGTFDPPKTKAEAFERVLGFGGTPDEASSISGHVPAKRDLVEWFRLTEDGNIDNTFTEGKKSLPDPEKHGTGWSLKRPSIPTTKEGTAKTREYRIWQDMISKNDRYADAYGRATGFIKRKEGISVSTLWSILKGISETLVDFGEDQTLIEDWAKSKLMEELGIGEEEIQEELNKEKESPAALGTRDNPIKVTSQEEFDALKHNQWYIDGEGLKQREIK